MPRYELKPNCVFVDAHDINPPCELNPPRGRKPVDIPHAHAMDKTIAPAQYTKLNDVAGFIGRFIVLGVDTDLYLPQIVASEYNISPAQAERDIQDVLGLLRPYLKNRETRRTHRAPQSHGNGQHPGIYELDFRVNILGLGVFKGPL